MNLNLNLKCEFHFKLEYESQSNVDIEFECENIIDYDYINGYMQRLTQVLFWPCLYHL